MKRKFIIMSLSTLLLCSAAFMTACASNAQASPVTQTTVNQTEVSVVGADITEKGGERKDPLQELVDSGKLSQTTYDAIQKYLKENMKSMSENRDKWNGQTPPERNNEKNERPERSENQRGDQGKTDDKSHRQGGPDGLGMMLNEKTLQAMLSDKVISESEYQILKDAIPQRPDVRKRDGAEKA